MRTEEAIGHVVSGAVSIEEAVNLLLEVANQPPTVRGAGPRRAPIWFRSPQPVKGAPFPLHTPDIAKKIKAAKEQKAK